MSQLITGVCTGMFVVVHLVAVVCVCVCISACVLCKGNEAHIMI